MGAKHSESCKTRSSELGEPETRPYQEGASGPCWLWGRTPDYAYTTVQVNGESKRIGVHQLAYQLAHGEIPKGLWVLHRCDTPNCFNPDHLFAGDHKANMEDAARKGRLHVKRPRRQRISVETIAEIRALVNSGTPQIAVAQRFGISKTFVCLLLKGRRRQYDAPLTPAGSAVADPASLAERAAS